MAEKPMTEDRTSGWGADRRQPWQAARMGVLTITVLHEKDT